MNYKSPIEFYFQSPHTGWCPTSIFEALYKKYLSLNKYNISHRELISNGEYNSSDSPHHLVIRNVNTKKYKACSYWDNVIALTTDSLGWSNDLCLGIYSSVQCTRSPLITPASYCCYTKDIEELITNNNILFENKVILPNKLHFRGQLYGDRKSIYDTIKEDDQITLTNNILSRSEYILEINQSKICLSLNGQAEICNRDIEILGAASVLFRPKLEITKFHNPLIEGFHYIVFEYNSSPHEQISIIKEKYNQIKRDEELLRYIAYNGNEWFKENGTISANVDVLYSLLNIKELINE